MLKVKNMEDAFELSQLRNYLKKQKAMNQTSQGSEEGQYL